MYELNEECPCGSGQKYGACCGTEEYCNCGSGETAGKCCFGTSEDEDTFNKNSDDSDDYNNSNYNDSDENY